MVDVLHIPIWNRITKPLAIALSVVGMGFRGEMMGVIQLMHNTGLMEIVIINPSLITNIY
jgi:hypothetical protein